MFWSQVIAQIGFLKLKTVLQHHMVWGKFLYSNLQMSKAWYNCAIHIHSELCTGVRRYGCLPLRVFTVTGVYRYGVCRTGVCCFLQNYRIELAVATDQKNLWY